MFRATLMVMLLAGCTPLDRTDELPRIDVEDIPEVTASSTTVKWTSVDAWRSLSPDVFPNVHAGEPMFDRIRGVLASRDGTCTTCNVVFGLDGDLDVSSVDVWFDGPEGLISAEFEWRPELETLTVRVTPGHAFEPGRHYVAVVDAVGADGLPLHAEAEFETAEPVREVRALRAALQKEPTPAAHVDRTWVGDEIDELLGRGQTAPGFERPSPVDPGEFAVRHETTSHIVTGSFSAPRVLDGSGSDVGVVQRHDGQPMVTRTDRVPFVLIVPRDADLQNLPVVVMQHGFSSSRRMALLLADTAGAAGWAVLGIDAYQHGARAAIATDRTNMFRGVDEPDGFAESNKLDVVSRVFGLGGVPTELRLCPEYALSAFTQFIADALTAIRFVREGELAALHEVDGLAGLRFDPSRVVYTGNSMGAVIGTGVIATEPDLAGAILNVMPGSIIETLAESGEFRPMSQRVFLPLLGVEHEFDGIDRRMLMDPTVDLFRRVMEPVDPLALARSRVVDNVLVQLAGQDEIAAPRPSASVVTAGGYEQVTVFDGGMHGMIEAVEQDSRYELPLVPPLQRRAETIRLANPIEAVHDEMTEFLLAIDPR